MGTLVRRTILLVTLITADALLYQVLSEGAGIPTPVRRLFSLSAALTATWLLHRALPAAPSVRRSPGTRPLVVVALLLDYGIFVTLALRTPEVQPLVHLGASWLGALLFAGLGFWRLRRWQQEEGGD